MSPGIGPPPSVGPLDRLVTSKWPALSEVQATAPPTVMLAWNPALAPPETLKKTGSFGLITMGMMASTTIVGKSISPISVSRGWLNPPADPWTFTWP